MKSSFETFVNAFTKQKQCIQLQCNARTITVAIKLIIFYSVTGGVKPTKKVISATCGNQIDMYHEQCKDSCGY